MEEKLVLFISEKEMDRLSIVRCILKKKLSWQEAGNQLHLSERQIARLVARVRAKGSRGIIHGLRGRPSNRRLKENVLARAIHLVKTHYPDFKPTFASEKLANHGIHLSRETLRKSMITAGLWRVNSRKPKHRQWRPRRLFLGELEQLDASYHDWFEGRAPRCALINYVDDATSRILYAEFVLGEDTMTLFKTTKRYLLTHGRPGAFYVDKHAVYHVNQQAIVESFLRDPQPMTQFTRAMTELGIEVITANSPQAKGRVERSFNTLQDRLVKEMRLRGIRSMAEANRFLWEEFIPEYNERFGKSPANPLNAHRPLFQTQKLEDILCLKTRRRVINDFTVRFKGQFFQILGNQSVIVKPKDKVTVIVHMNGSIDLELKGHKLEYKPIAKDTDSLESASKYRFPEFYAKPLSLESHPHRQWQASLRFEELRFALRALDKKPQHDISILQNT